MCDYVQASRNPPQMKGRETQKMNRILKSVFYCLFSFDIYMHLYYSMGREWLALTQETRLILILYISADYVL
jgi:hypothetical protein